MTDFIASSGSVLTSLDDGSTFWSKPLTSGFIFEDYTPSFSVSAGSLSNLTVYFARFIHVGDVCYYNIGAKFDLSASASYVTFTLPVDHGSTAAETSNSIGSFDIENSGSPEYGFSWINHGYGTDIARVYRENVAAWDSGTNKRIRACGSYTTSGTNSIT